MLTLEIPRIPESPNDLRRFHWRHRHRHDKLWKDEIRYAVLQSRPRDIPFARARVSIERRSVGRLDPDNLVSAMKPVIDALRHAGVIENDTDAHIELVVTQCQTRSLPPRTLIEIRPLPPNVTQDVLIPTPLYEVRG
jgi:Holliday junction resolvase RusA-like endonuclease